VIRAQTLLFDLDGTLTDNYAGIAASIRHALDRIGAPPPPDAALRTCVGPPLRESFARLLGTGDTPTIERAVAHYRERFADVGWKENVVYAGVADALVALAARGARMYVCTAKPATFARRIVEHFDLARHFRAVYGADFDGRFDDKSALMAHVIATEILEAPAATSGSTSRPFAWKSRKICTDGKVASSCERAATCMSVAMMPGRSEIAWMPRGPCSAAIPAVSISRPAFATE